MFLDTLEGLSERFGIDVFAYVLMPNHYHLLVRTRLANLKKAMHWFGTTYTQRFNHRHSRTGHLFQGRYKSIIVENEAYLLQLSCYIHRNPLRAGIVKRLADYPWSSYLAYTYYRSNPSWLSTALLLSQFGTEDSRDHYRNKVQSYADEEQKLWENFHHGLFLGTADFVKRMRDQHLPSEPDGSIPHQIKTAKPVNAELLLRAAEQSMGCEFRRFGNAGRVTGEEKDRRDIMVYLLWQSGHYSNHEIGRMFGISYSAVSHVIRGLKTKMRENPQFLDTLNHIYSQIKL